MADRDVTLGLVQFSPSRDPDLNMKLAMENVRAAAQRGANIVCLPELYRTRYFPQQDVHRSLFRSGRGAVYSHHSSII
ncbi:MAG: hypothetical protein LUO92_04725 [Methanothrix sp.]|nr:hypothetical protein [Methanothrix sp.]